MSSDPRYLFNSDGSVFTDLSEVEHVLSELGNDDRISYRDGNAAEIVASTDARLLVVAGPGAGKSHLFLERIKAWLPRHPDGRVQVATFVRKLIRDLESDISTKLTEEQAQRVSASTLHSLARSLVARNKGTSALPLGKYVRVIDGYWANVIWRDVLAFHPDLKPGTYTLKAFENQLHTEDVANSADWPAVREIQLKLTAFYGAVGFAQFIVLAREAVEENPELVEHDLWIIDEYHQDFNASEDNLIQVLVANAAGVLMAGDDEQALYQTLKASTPDIIIGYYNDATFAKAMLPFCSRCGYHICSVASAFMAAHRGEGSIDKIYLPLKVDEEAPRVKIVATAAPASAVEYVRAFMEERSAEYKEYLERRDACDDTDPFLLILSPSGGLTPKKNDTADDDLKELVASYGEERPKRSADYLRTLNYATAGWYDADNFAVRKLLHEADVPSADIHSMIAEALDRGEALGEVVARQIALMDTARQVAALLGDAEGNEAQTVAEIAKLIKIHDSDGLATELAEHPVRNGEVREEEDEAVIETVGAVAPVALMPITGSKGLSAHHVVVLGCDNVNMALTSPLTFFVALTRARETLHLVFSAKASGAKSLHPFVTELPEGACEYLVFKKDRSTESFGTRSGLVKRVAMWSSFSGRGKRR